MNPDAGEEAALRLLLDHRTQPSPAYFANVYDLHVGRDTPKDYRPTSEPIGVEESMTIEEGCLWRHLETREVVRVDRSLGGLLTFSIYRKGRWVLCRNLWDEVEFRQKFEPYNDQWSPLKKLLH